MCISNICLYKGSGDLNSGPSTRAASPLSTKPSCWPHLSSPDISDAQLVAASDVGPTGTQANRTALTLRVTTQLRNLSWLQEDVGQWVEQDVCLSCRGRWELPESRVPYHSGGVHQRSSQLPLTGCGSENTRSCLSGRGWERSEAGAGFPFRYLSAKE